MITEKIRISDALREIKDIRHLVAILFNTTDLIFIKKVLNKSGYPFGSPDLFVKRLNVVHEEYILNGKDIDSVKSFGGVFDPFDKIEESIKKTDSNILFCQWLKDLKC